MLTGTTHRYCTQFKTAAQNSYYKSPLQEWNYIDEFEVVFVWQNRANGFMSLAISKANLGQILTHTYTKLWQRQSWKQVKMTQKHIQAKASMDKLCETAKSTLLTYQKETQPQRPISSPSRSLSSLHCWKAALSDIYTGPTSGLIVTLLSNVLFLWYFPLFYLPSLSIYSRSANIRLVHSNRVLSSLYQYKTLPLTADWLQVCFGTRSDTAVKSVFLSACLRSGGLGHHYLG